MTGPSPTTEPAVLFQVVDRVAIITLNRPDRLNAYDDALAAGLFGRLNEAADRDDVRAIVLTGAGRGFCAGADFAVLDDLGDGSREFALPDSPFTTPRAIGKPVVAALNGPCAGIGLVIALMCDLRFATPQAKLVTGFARRGLVAEQGLAWLLTRLVGPSRALDLLFSSRPVLGEEALPLGLVDRLYPADELLEATVAYARDLADHASPASLAAVKWQVQRAMESGLEQAIEDADELTQRSLVGRDFVTLGATVGRGDLPGYAPAPATRLGEQAPLELFPPAAAAGS